MTNPTPPLTAHDVELLVRGYDVPVKPEESERRDYLMDTFIHMSNQEVIEAYAAQKNAEMVATISQLNSDIAGLSGKFLRVESDYKLAVEEIKVLKGELAQAEIKACQRGKAWIELSSQNERLNKALKAVIENDKTHYNHHEPRSDGKLPKEEGGTIWLTPKEIAKRNLPQPPKEVK